MPRTEKLRARVREGLSKLTESSTCADEAQADALAAEGFNILTRVAFSGEQVREAERVVEERKPPSLRESMPFITGQSSENPRDAGKDLLHRVLGPDADL